MRKTCAHLISKNADKTGYSVIIWCALHNTFPFCEKCNNKLNKNF